MKIRIEIANDTLTAALQGLLAANEDLTPLMREYADFLSDRVEENFASEGRPEWAPLSEVTIARRGGDAHPILQRSGQLAASIDSAFDATSAIAGTNKVYGPTMQFGAKKGEFGRTKRGAPIPWGDIPARPFLAVTDRDQVEILEILADYQRRAARS